MLVKNERKSLIKIDEEHENSEEAQKILQAVAESVQKIAHDKIANVVSRCLEAVFDEPYKFIIDFERKRGKTEANLTFERDGLSMDPLSASGGGVVDVAAFALRLACLLLTRPPLKRILLLDEPFRFVSNSYRPRIRSLLESLSDEMNVQFIIVTHISALKCGKVIEVE